MSRGGAEMTFDIAWTRRVAHQWRTKADDWVIEATLTERVLLGGKPAIKVICRIAAIDEDKSDAEAAIGSGTPHARGSASCIASTATPATASSACSRSRCRGRRQSAPACQHHKPRSDASPLHGAATWDRKG